MKEASAKVLSKTFQNCQSLNFNKCLSTRVPKLATKKVSENIQCIADAEDAENFSRKKTHSALVWVLCVLVYETEDAENFSTKKLILSQVGCFVFWFIKQFGNGICHSHSPHFPVIPGHFPVIHSKSE